jgi:hypothetical protein
MAASPSSLTLDTPIPTGPWVLYHHSMSENKWTLSTFQNVATMSTWREFWAVMEALRSSTLTESMFFLMRKGIDPLYENFQNIRGGSYSLRINKDQAGECFIAYAIAMMLGEATTEKANVINGMSISPKRGFCILKVWNTDCIKYKDPAELTIHWEGLHPAEILYTPHVEKKL